MQGCMAKKGVCGENGGICSFRWSREVFVAPNDRDWCMWCRMSKGTVERGVMSLGRMTVLGVVDVVLSYFPFLIDREVLENRSMFWNCTYPLFFWAI
jgi:hypothetical protein